MDGVRFTKLAMTGLRSNFVKLGKPYKLTFSATYWCNSHCLTCQIWKTRPTGEMTLEEVQEFTKRNSSFKWVEITGGEPFLRSDIVAVARAFYDNCKGLYIITMPTNSLCPPDLIESRIEQILGMGIPRLSITLSLDGYRELHDRIRGVRGNFDKVMEMGRRLHALQQRRRNLFFVFGYTMSRYNKGMLEKTIDEVRKILPWVTANDFHVNASQVSSIYYSNEGTEIMDERETMAKEISWLMGKRRFEIGAIPLIEGAFLRHLVGYMKTGKAPMKSRCMEASLFLDSYGNVYPSIMWGRKIGNIRDTGYSLEPLWDNEEAKEVRRLVKEGKEPNAWTACEAYQALVGNAIHLLY